MAQEVPSKEETGARDEDEASLPEFTVETIYVQYDLYLQSLLQTGDLCSFKQNRLFNRQMEHLPKPMGDRYYLLLKAEFPFVFDVVVPFCKLNDSIGKPQLHPVLRFSHAEGEPACVSPTSLRYAYQACLLLKHIKETMMLVDCEPGQQTPEVNVVEIGAGYGGLALAVSELSSCFPGLAGCIKSYTLLDLPSGTELEKLYLANFKLNFDVQCVSAARYGSDLPTRPNTFLVSHFTFGEIRPEYQQLYIKHLFPKVSHGMITWNLTPVFDFGKQPVKVSQERPLTGDGNQFVYF